MQVLKFGGSSVADATRISAVLDIVGAAAQKDRVLVVFSAISGCTDTLLHIASAQDAEEKEALIAPLKARHHAIIKRLFTGSEREEAITEIDRLFAELSSCRSQDCVCYGELFSTKIIARKMECEGVKTSWLDSRKLIITREGTVDQSISYQNIADAVRSAAQAQVFIAPGFIASDESGRMTTLGRGGSDYSAALYAAALNAAELQIWTDVPGIMTANPKDIPAAQSIPNISYEAALTLAENGAKVLYAPTVGPAMEKGIAINIRSSYDPGHPGTVISEQGAEKAQHFLGVTSLEFKQEARGRLCLVGEAVSSRKSAVGRILSALGEAGISPLGEVGGSAGTFFLDVRAIVLKEALAAVHREFFEERAISKINVFLAGFGAVGQSFAELISKNKEKIEARTGKSIRIVGVSNSSRYHINLRGINPSEITSRLEEGQSAADGAYIDAVCAAAPRRSVFVDCTNSPSLHESYDKLFKSGLNIVTSNRRSLSLPYVQYAAIKASARENGAFFRYDTTVANALPILESIAGEANCSDGINAIEAVVSCTLNYIITGYDGNRGESFASLLKRAHEEGLSEKDPRIDLGGSDVLRKLLILAREAGIPLEAEDVEIRPMLSEEFFSCPLEQFYRLLAEYEPKFVAREDELDELGLRQRFIASIKKDSTARLGYKAEIKMQTVGIDSPFYWISGTENVIAVTGRYSAPLVIKGAGEGRRLAAAGIIKDILS